MPLGDLPLPVQFLLFLLVFVLIGLYPAWKRSAAKIRRHLLRRAEAPPRAQLGFSELLPAASGQYDSKPLDSYEILILRRLAQAGTGGLSRRQLGRVLFLDAANVRRTLQALHNRGLLEITVGQLLGVRFALSAKGRDCAIAQDFIPRVRAQAGRR